jgi:hypothetical protein
MSGPYVARVNGPTEDGTVAATRPARPAERYGDRPGRSLRAAIVVAALAGFALLGVGWLVWLRVSTPMTAELTAYTVRSAHRIDVTVRIDRSGAFAGSCSVRALADDHSVVGRDTIMVESGGPRTVTVSRTVRTDRPATTAEVGSCRRR